MKISGVVAKFYFNTSGGGFLPSKCYLNPIAIPRITPFLGLFEDLALDGQCPLLGLLVLNILEVAPTAEHLGFLISLGSAWIATYQDSVQFWSEYQFGKRLPVVFFTSSADRAGSVGSGKRVESYAKENGLAVYTVRGGVAAPLLTSENLVGRNRAGFSRSLIPLGTLAQRNLERASGIAR